MTDCRQCKNSVKSYSALLCTAMNMPRPVEFMRHECSECGPHAMMFEDKDKKYSEFDDAR